MTAAPARRVVAFVVVVAALAGCSTIAGGGAPTGTTVSIRQQVTPIYRELAQCFRDHGYPGFPDPVVKDDGTVEPFSEEVERNIDRLEATLRQHCEHIFNRLPASVREGSGGNPDEAPYTPAQVDQLRRFAQCMREHGMPEWPDPKADGTFPIPETVAREGKSRRLLNAMGSCRDLNPDPKGGVRGSR
jgi:hypothetical protein